MKAPCILLVGAALALAQAVFGQTLVLQHEKAPVLPKRASMSAFFERDLDQALALKPRDPNALDIDLRFLGSEISPELLKTGFSWRLNDDETITLRSKLVYRYEPRHWPTGFRDLFKKAVIHPVSAFLSKHFE